jgi:hypothetical protein
MVIVYCPETANDSDVIRASPDFFKPIANLETTFPIALKTSLQRHDDFTISMVWVPRLDFCADLFGVKDISVRGLLDGFSSVLIELRFDIKALEMRDATTEKDPNDRLGFGADRGTSALNLRLPR